MEFHPTTLDDAKLLAQCTQRRTRRSGPGGQHRNKVESAIILTHEPTGVAAEANERRSQAENKVVALFRLRLKLALEVRTPNLQPIETSPLWQSRVHRNRIAINPLHADFPALLTESLDAICFYAWDTKRAAEALNISPSQLVKFLKLDPRGLLLVNRQRELEGLGGLR